MSKLQSHPFSELFPLISEEEKNELADDIVVNGLLHPIIMYEGKILDGRNRYDACIEVNVKPAFEEYRGTNPLAFVISCNLNRRHLTTSQRAMIAAQIENMPQGRPQNKQVNCPLPRKHVAETLSVSESSVQRASRVLNQSPQLAKEVLSGKVTVNGALNHIATTPFPTRSTPTAGPKRLDKVGRVIPDKIVALWDQSEADAKAALDALSKIRCSLRTAQEEDNLCYREMTFASTLSILNSAYSDFQRLAPYAVCYLCQGLLPAKCAACKGRGFTSKYFWDMCVPAEFKKLVSKK